MRLIFYQANAYWFGGVVKVNAFILFFIKFLFPCTMYVRRTCIMENKSNLLQRFWKKKNGDFIYFTSRNSYMSSLILKRTEMAVKIIYFVLNSCIFLSSAFRLSDFSRIFLFFNKNKRICGRMYQFGLYMV